MIDLGITDTGQVLCRFSFVLANEQSKIQFPAFKCHHVAYDRTRHALGDLLKISDFMRSYKHTNNSTSNTLIGKIIAHVILA